MNHPIRPDLFRFADAASVVDCTLSFRPVVVSRGLSVRFVAVVARRTLCQFFETPPARRNCSGTPGHIRGELAESLKTPQSIVYNNKSTGRPASGT